jgi:hypothetical protein
MKLDYAEHSQEFIWKMMRSGAQKLMKKFGFAETTLTHLVAR